MTRPLDVIARLVPDHASHVAVVAPGGLDLAALEAPGRVVRRHEPDGVARLHDLLAAHGHVDALVDLARGRGATDRLPMLLAHVRRGGILVVALPPGHGPRTRLLDLLDDVARLRAGALDPPARRRDDRPSAERDLHALAASIGEVTLADDHVRLTMDVDTWRVVPERRFDRFLAGAPGSGRVVAHEPAATWTATAQFTSSEPGERPIGTVTAPPLSLREYDDVVVAPRLVAHTGGVVLPQAFRNTARTRPHTPVLTDWSPWSVLVPDELVDRRAEPLPGTWFHADNILRGHFGHALTEQISQLWAWPAVLERHPDAGVLVTAAEEPLAAWELLLLEAAGVPRERVRAAPGPVRVERLLAATPSYVITRHLHPVLREVQRGVGDALEAQSRTDPAPERLFLTRRGLKRACRNAGEIEELFTCHGFRIVVPEEHPLPDQVAMVRAATAVAGFGGSGLLHLALGGAPRPVIAVSSTGYHVWNEKAIAAFWDHPLTVVRGTPDVVSDRFTVQAFHSTYVVDMAREGRVLQRALDQLG